MILLDLKRRKDISLFAVISLSAGTLFLILIHQLSQYIAGHPDNSVAPWLAVLPIVALFAIVVLAMRSLGRMDELERKMHTDAMSFAFLGSIFLIGTYGMLRLADLLVLPEPWLPMMMMICWVIGLLLAIKRYR